jgi:hypothetical protein
MNLTVKKDSKLRLFIGKWQTIFHEISLILLQHNRDQSSHSKILHSSRSLVKALELTFRVQVQVQVLCIPVDDA